MNKLQRKIFILAVALLAAAGIIPPWKIESQGRVVNMGYWFITNPPVKINSYGYKFSSVINVQTLLIEWAVIAIIFIGLIYFFKNDN